MIKGILDRLAAPLSREKYTTATISSFSDGRAAYPNERPHVDQLLRMVKGDVYACVSLLASSVAEAAKVHLFRKGTQPANGNGGPRFRSKAIDRRMLAHIKASTAYLDDVSEYEQIVDHPLLDMFETINPLPWFGGYEFFETWSIYSDTARFAAFITKDPAGMPVELWPLPPGPLRAVVSRTGYVDYWEYGHGSDLIRFEVDEILYHRRSGPAIDALDGIYGFPPLRGVLTAAEASQTLYEYERDLLNNRAVPELVLKVAGSNNREKRDRLFSAWRNRSGGSRAGGVQVIGEDVEVQPVGFSPKDLQNIEAAKSLREVIANAFGVPLSILTMESSNRAVADAGLVQLGRFALRPRLKRIQDTINQTIIPLYDATRSLFVCFPDPVPEDEEAIVAKNVAYLQNKVYTINEVRESEGVEPHAEGDQLFRPMPTFGVGGTDATSSEESNSGNDEATKSVRLHLHPKTMQDDAGDTPEMRGLRGTMNDIFARQLAEVLAMLPEDPDEKAVHTKVASPDLWTQIIFDLERWIEITINETLEALTTQVAQGARAGAAVLTERGFGIAFDITSDAADLFFQAQGRAFVEKFATYVTTTTRDSLHGTIAAAIENTEPITDLAKRINDIPGFDKGSQRAEMIARTETKRASQSGRRAMYDESDADGLIWATSSDPCPWCAPFEGRQIPASGGAVFASKGDVITGEFTKPDGTTVIREMTLNYSDTPNPPLHPNCMCVVLPI